MSFIVGFRLVIDLGGYEYLFILVFKDVGGR